MRTDVRKAPERTLRQECSNGCVSWMLSFQLQKSPTPNLEEKCGNSPDISKGISQSGICKFESSKVSQTVPVAEKPSAQRPERPTIGGLLRFAGRSPCSRTSRLGVEFAESLRLSLRIFPFSRDWRQRLGSITTVWRGPQSYSAHLGWGLEQTGNLTVGLPRGLGSVGCGTTAIQIAFEGPITTPNRKFRINRF